jgi:hypothetical protein
MVAIEQRVDARSAQIIHNFAGRARTEVRKLTPLPSGIIEVDMGFTPPVFYNPTGWPALRNPPDTDPSEDHQSQKTGLYRWNLSEEPGVIASRPFMEKVARQRRKEYIRECTFFAPFSSEDESLRGLLEKVRNALTERSKPLEPIQGLDDGSTLITRVSVSQKGTHIKCNRTFGSKKSEDLLQEGKNRTDVFFHNLTLWQSKGKIDYLDISVTLLNGMEVCLFYPLTYTGPEYLDANFFITTSNPPTEALFQLKEQDGGMTFTPVLRSNQLSNIAVSDRIPQEAAYEWYKFLIHHLADTFEQAGLLESQLPVK